MYKLLVVFLVTALLLVVAAPSFAQDQTAIPACTEDELAAVVEQLTPIEESFQEAATSMDPSSPDYVTSIVDLDAIAVSVWVLDVPFCAEAQALIYFKSYQYDEQVIVALLTNMAAAFSGADDPETAEALSEQVAARLEIIMAEVEAFGGLTFEELAGSLVNTGLEPCTEEELAAGAEMMTTTVQALQEATFEQAEDQIAVFRATEDLTFQFWNEGYFEMATCIEYESVAIQLGAALSLSDVVAGLRANAAIEKSLGNEDVAEVLTASADFRAEVLAVIMGGE